MSKRNRIARQQAEAAGNGEATGVLEQEPEVAEETPAGEVVQSAAQEQQDAGLTEAGLLAALEGKIAEQDAKIKELEAKLAAATAPKAPREGLELPNVVGKPAREVIRKLMTLGWSDVKIVKAFARSDVFLAPNTLKNCRVAVVKGGKTGCELTAEEIAGLEEKAGK